MPTIGPISTLKASMKENETLPSRKESVCCRPFHVLSLSCVLLSTDPGWGVGWGGAGGAPGRLPLQNEHRPPPDTTAWKRLPAFWDLGGIHKHLCGRGRCSPACANSCGVKPETGGGLELSRHPRCGRGRNTETQTLRAIDLLPG